MILTSSHLLLNSAIGKSSCISSEIGKTQHLTANKNNDFGKDGKNNKKIQKAQVIRF